MPDELLDKYPEDYDPELELEAMEIGNYEDKISGAEKTLNGNEFNNEIF